MQKHIKCLIQACEKLKIEYAFIDKECNFIRVNISGYQEYFQQNKTPFNSETFSGICKDKMHSYELFKDIVRMPETIAFLDFDIDDKYKQSLDYYSVDSAINLINQSFKYPIVIKSNKGSLGINVYLCENNESILKSFKTIFNKQSKNYDYIALAQQFIPAAEEYRLVCCYGKPLLAYKRGNASSFNVKYWENGESAQLIENQDLFKELYDFIKPVFQQINIGFVGFDIVRGKDNQLYLIELNASPKFDHLIEENESECVIEMYIQSLSMLRKKIDLNRRFYE